MFQKLAMAVKTKTYEFFTDEPDPDQSLLNASSPSLISSIFATVSSFEASYLQLQASHSPFIEQNVKLADKAIVSNLQKLSDLKKFYRNHEFDLAIGSCLESMVQENQSKLRALETVSNRLQGEMDSKDLEVWNLRKKLDEIQKSKSLCLSVRVYESLLHDAFKATKKFTKILIELMEKAGWDLELVAKSVYPEVEYVKKGHNRYALLSYVCLGMFRGFDGEDLNDEGEMFSDPMEVLDRDKDCGFSRFCDEKYQEVVHLNMASLIDQNEDVLSSWRSLDTFYESFVIMASSIWTLRKLALLFDPAVEVFRVESGVDFSIVFMENVLKRKQDEKFSMKYARGKVGFTVVPGFKLGCTVIQSRVYLTGFKSK